MAEATVSVSEGEHSTIVVPLGGCGEIGLNATLFIQGQDALLVDCGALLQVPNSPGVDKAVPGLEALKGKTLRGLVLTHGHEDHIGGLPSLLSRYDVPVFGTGVTLDFARSRLERAPSAEAKRQRGRFTEVDFGTKAQVGPFEVEWVRVTHSLPDCAALVINSAAGRIVHSGDFKLDRHPVHGEPTDQERLIELGREGVDLLLADSTNSERDGRTISETVVAETLEDVVGEASGRIYMTLFASHLHRIRSAIRAAERHGRRIAILGRSLERTWKMAAARGIIKPDPGLLLGSEYLKSVPRERVLVLCTGSQGEWQGGLHKVAHAKEQSFDVQSGDSVIMSSRVIPGNGPQLRRLLNLLAEREIRVVTDRMMPIHCSGHAHREEQVELLSWLKPKNFVPLHGDRTMLEAHARTARGQGVESLVLMDGDSVVLDDHKVSRGPQFEFSRRPLDRSGREVAWDEISDRNRIGRNGLAVCTLVLDNAGRLEATPVVTTRARKVPELALRRIGQDLAHSLGSYAFDDEAQLRKRCQSELRKLFGPSGIKPEVEVHVVRLTRKPKDASA